MAGTDMNTQFNVRSVCLVHGMSRPLLPGQNWTVLVTSTPDTEDWGYVSSPSGLSATTELIHGYRHIAIAGPVFSGDATSAEIQSFLTVLQLRTLSGTPQTRASSLQSMLISQFPDTRWNVAVKKDPGGFGNWAYWLVARASFQSGWMTDDDDDYNYVVWTTTASNRRPIVPTLGPYTIGVLCTSTHPCNMSIKLELSGSHSLLKFAYDHKSQL